MKLIKTNNAEGKMHQVVGMIKEVVGKVFNNRNLETEGKEEQIFFRSSYKMPFKKI